MKVHQSHSQYDRIVVNTTDFRKIKQNLDMAREQVIDELVYNFQYIGEQAVKIAREGGTYNDITGNLRSSIGYVVLVDGQPAGTFSGQYEQFHGQPNADGKTPNGREGVAQAKALLEELRGRYRHGVVLILVAGMKYAAFVEEVYGRVVLSEAQTLAEHLVRKLLRPYLQ